MEGVSYDSTIPVTNRQTIHSQRIPEQADSNVSILYYNTRSILPKLACLRAGAIANNPSIICIVETWLSENILSDSEISVENYQIARLDLNKHGGGVPINVHSQFPELGNLTEGSQ